MNWEEVRDQLVEAVRLSWRMPAGGFEPSSFATDGPWRLLTRGVRAEAGGMAWMELWRALQDAAKADASRLRTVPLTAEEVTWMEQRIEWLLLIQERDRKLVWEGLWQLARGRSSIDWGVVRAMLPVEIGRKGLYRRFVRALQGLAQELNSEAQRKAA